MSWSGRAFLRGSRSSLRESSFASFNDQLVQWSVVMKVIPTSFRRKLQSLRKAMEQEKLSALPWDEGRVRKSTWVNELLVTDRFVDGVGDLIKRKGIRGDLGIVGWAFMPTANKIGICSISKIEGPIQRPLMPPRSHYRVPAWPRFAPGWNLTSWGWTETMSCVKRFLNRSFSETVYSKIQ